MFGTTRVRAMPRPGWQSRALCVGNMTPFFSYDDHDQRGRASDVVYAEAKAICARCPVRKECLAYALDNRVMSGVWGGKSARERRNILKSGR